MKPKTKATLVVVAFVVYVVSAFLVPMPFNIIMLEVFPVGWVLYAIWKVALRWFEDREAKPREGHR